VKDENELTRLLRKYNIEKALPKYDLSISKFQNSNTTY